MIDKEYLLDIKIKNNLLYQKIMSTGLTVAEFSEKYNIDSSAIYKLLNFKMNIYTKNNQLRKSVIKLLKIFNCEISDLFPKTNDIKNNRFIHTISEKDMLSLSYMSNDTLLISDFNDPVEKEVNDDIIEYILNLVSPRQRYILKMHYFNNMSFTDIAEQLGTSKQNVNLLYKNAMLRLKRKITKEKIMKHFSLK